LTTIKVPSNFTEVLMALILPAHGPRPDDIQMLDLETGLEGSENLDLIVVDSNQLTYVPSQDGVRHDSD